MEIRNWNDVWLMKEKKKKNSVQSTFPPNKHCSAVPTVWKTRNFLLLYEHFVKSTLYLFSENVAFTNFCQNSLRVNHAQSVWVEITELPRFCRKNSVKSTLLLKKYSKLIWREKKNCVWQCISRFSTLCKFYCRKMKNLVSL